MNGFHLSLPVKDVSQTKAFYCGLLGGQYLQLTKDYLEVQLFGHQLSFHAAPAQMLDANNFHWGFWVDWPYLHTLVDQLQTSRVPLLQPPIYQLENEAEEKMKVLFLDPNGYQLEYKAKRRVPIEHLNSTGGKRSFWSLWQGAFTKEMCLLK
ncbi:MAG: VOC family protein [Rufibacter sp.]